MVKKIIFLIIISLFAVGTVFGFGIRASLEGYSNNISGDENNMALASRLLAGFTFNEMTIIERLKMNLSAGLSGFNIMGKDLDGRIDYTGAFIGLTLTQSFSDSTSFLRFGVFDNLEIDFGFRQGRAEEQILLFSTTAGLDVALGNLHGYLGGTYSFHKILNPEREIHNVSRVNIFLGAGLVFSKRKTQNRNEEDERNGRGSDGGDSTISIMEGSGLVIL